MKRFDFLQALKGHRPEWVSWLKENQHKPVTLEEFIVAYQALRATDTRPHKAVRYSPSHIRNQYKGLREKFGFFPQ